LDLCIKTNKLVMGIVNKIISKNDETQALDPNQLTGKELEFLLNILRESNLKGSQVELFYNLAIKLQNQYIKQTQK